MGAWQGLKESMKIKFLKQCLTHRKHSKMLAIIIWLEFLSSFHSVNHYLNTEILSLASGTMSVLFSSNVCAYFFCLLCSYISSWPFNVKGPQVHSLCLLSPQFPQTPSSTPTAAAATSAQMTPADFHVQPRPLL